MYTWEVFRYTYIALALSHILVQIVLAEVENQRQRRRYLPEKAAEILERINAARPCVTVVVPVHNEPNSILDACLQALIAQTYTNLKIIVVDDGSVNVKEHELTYGQFNPNKLTVVELEENVGKRLAMKVGFDAASEGYVCTIDSDTIVRDPDAITKLLIPFFMETGERVLGAVTGQVTVENRGHNLLTRLISLRYWMAFNQERAPQSLFGIVMCCSGPFSLYRIEAIRQVEERFVSQRFLGKYCTYGDDRHLTNLVLEAGYSVRYTQFAEALTHVPESLTGYAKQQVRWNRSFYREMWWTLRFAGKRNPYMGYDLLLQAFLPFMLIVALAGTFYQSATNNPEIIARYALIVLGIGFLRSLYGFVRTHDKRFFQFLAYGFMHVLMLIPIRLYAICTIRSNDWMTRRSKQATAAVIE